MLLTFDVGNTNITVCGIADGEVVFNNCFATSLYSSDNGYQTALADIFHKNDIDIDKLEGSIISSVVPQADDALRDAAALFTERDPRFVKADDDTGLEILGYDKNCLGIDRLIVASAAAKHYGTPVCVYDLGSASTLSVVDSSGYFRGGAITAGVQLQLDILAKRCARLPHYEARAAEPGAVIGTDVKSCMENGAIIGTAAMIDGMIKRVSRQLNCKEGELKLVLTGGNAPFVLPFIMTQGAVYDPFLIHKGMELIWRR